jgi:hypothetical protein
MIELWVPIIGSGTEEDPYRPDVPAGVRWATGNGVPVDLGPDSPTYGRPVNGHMLIRVADGDAPSVKAAVPAEQVPAEERALVACVRVPGRPGAVTPEEELEIGRRLDEFGLSREAADRVLAQMVLRGLGPEAVKELR